MSTAAPPRAAAVPTPEEALAEAVGGLRRRKPSASAAHVLDPWQKVVLALLLVIVAVGLVLRPALVATTLTAICTVAYISAVGYRALLFRAGLDGRALTVVTDVDARVIPESRLPVYTILVPAYDEPGVVDRLVKGLGALEYPREKLDIKLLLEADDEATITAARTAHAERLADVILVPPSEPRTKPKACNYGLQFAHGEITTIYDAEDEPDPLQLRRVVAAFDRLGPEYACIQAKLVYHNADQNLVTRWFATEYGLWFSVFLPGLVALKAPIPLGGTSNHIRTDVLIDAGAWDPFNVTEDADLGIRLRREGMLTAVLDSDTLEEANSDAINWIRQRSRWYKGYLQTLLVHLRHPVQLVRELGVRGTIGFLLTVGGTPLLAACNPIFWILAGLWIAGRPGVIEALFPPWVYYAALFSLIVGNFLTLYTSIIGARLMSAPHLLWSALLSPLYWILMSTAAIKALVQLITKPSYWEKTVHGLDHTDDAP